MTEIVNEQIKRNEEKEKPEERSAQKYTGPGERIEESSPPRPVVSQASLVVPHGSCVFPRSLPPRIIGLNPQLPRGIGFNPRVMRDGQKKWLCNRSTMDDPHPRLRM